MSTIGGSIRSFSLYCWDRLGPYCDGASAAIRRDYVRLSNLQRLFIAVDVGWFNCAADARAPYAVFKVDLSSGAACDALKYD
jgi:hypothetical protein